jgi:hypothetical protein
MRPAGRPKHATTSSALEDFEKNDENSGFRYRALRPLDPIVQADFIAVEHERGFIDSMYARVVATLRQAQYPDHLIQLPLRILSDGMRHEGDFLQIQAALKPFDPAKYLRTLTIEDKPSDGTKAALALIDEIVAQLRKAYDLAGNELLARSSKPIAEARKAMYELLDVGETLAAKGIGIPFFDKWGGTTPGPPGSAVAPGP